MRRKRRKAELTKVKRNRHGFRGMPPPPRFSLGDLPDDAMLTDKEVAAVLRKCIITVQSWRKDPNHRLAWQTLPDGFVRYRVSTLRNYLADGQPRPPVGARVTDGRHDDRYLARGE
jgi:hypothetical protein